MNELPIILDKDSILVGPEIADALGRPPHIQIQINEEKKRLLLQPCGVDEREDGQKAADFVWVFDPGLQRDCV